MKVLIIGNGVVGLSTAFQLLKNNVDKITIVGPSSRLGAATPAAAAMLNSFAEVEESTLSNPYGIEYFNISRKAAALWPSFEKEVAEMSGDNKPKECGRCDGNNGGCFGKGTYVVQNTTSDSLEDRNYHAIIAALKERKEEFTHVNPSDIPGYSPSESGRALNALHIPDEGWVNPNLILGNLEAAIYKNSSVKYIDDKVSELEWDDKRIVKAKLELGLSIEDFDQVVLATGSLVSDLIKNSPFENVIQPVLSSFGTSIELRSNLDNLPKNCIRSPNRGGGCGTYCVSYFKSQNSPKHYFIGASSIIRETPSFYGRSVSVSHLLDSATSEINENFYGAEVIKINAGNRPASFDQYPLLGKVDDSNLSICTGTKRDGLHCAPVLSMYLVDEIFDRNDSSHPYKIFKPDRELINVCAREKSVDSIVDMKINEAYQHNFNPSSLFQKQLFRTALKDEAEKVHDYFNLNEIGIHPSMYPLYREISLGRLESKFLEWYSKYD